nr:hypothetical protein [Tanacetum cinerariifolium]
MASFDYRLNPLYPIKECSSYGALYTTDYCCSEGSLGDKIICDLNKTPDLSQQHLDNCPKCENPVDGHYCQGCALLRKKLRKICLHVALKMEFSNVLPSHPMTIPTLLMLFKSHSLSIKTPHMEQLTSMCDMVGQYIQKKEEEKQIEEEQAAKTRYWKIPVCYDDDDEDYTIAITPNQPNNSLNIPKEIYSNPLFDEEIISMKIYPHHFNAESDLIDSLLNRDSLIISSSSKIDSLFDEFASELTLLKSILPGINETDCDPEEEIRLIKRLLYDNSSPHPPEEFISESSDTAFESFSPFSIPVEDSDSLMEEIDLSFTSDDPMPPGIKEDDYDSKRDIPFLEELLSNDSLSLPKNESFHFDIPSSSRPPAKPPDGNSRTLNVKVMGDIFEHKVLMPRLMFTQPTLVSDQENLLVSYLIRAMKLFSLLLNAR